MVHDFVPPEVDTGQNVPNSLKAAAYLHRRPTVNGGSGSWSPLSTRAWLVRLSYHVTTNFVRYSLYVSIVLENRPNTSRTPIVRLVTYNIQYSRGKDDQFDIARVVDAVKDADIIALQEVERFWLRTGMVDQPAEIAALLPQHYWVFAPFFDMHAGAGEETEARDNRRRQFGPMLLSKLPIQWSRSHHFRKIATFNRFNMDTGALETLVETSTGPIRFFSLQLSALDVRERLLQTESLLAINERARLDGPPWTGPPVTGGDTDWAADSPPTQTSPDAVLMGDFNSEPHDAVYDRLVGPKDEYSLRVHRVDTFVDTWTIVHDDEIGEATWIRPPGYPGNGDQRVDYCFVSPALVGRVLNAWVDSEAQGSDHQPYWVEIDF